MRKLLPAALLSVVVAASALYGLRYPEYNWDLIPYLAAALALDEREPGVVHAKAYAEARAALPEGRYAELAFGDGYRRTVHDSPEALQRQLPFYTIRPLYVGLVRGLHELGVGLARSTVLASTLAYLAIALVLWHWLAAALSPWPRAAAVTLLSFSPPLAEVGNLSTPDGLSAALVLGGLLFVIRDGSRAIGGALLWLSLLARTDNLLVCLAVAALWAVQGRRSFVGSGIYALLCVATVGLVEHLAGNYGWAAVVHHSFFGKLVDPSSFEGGVEPLAYARLLLFGLFSMRYSMLGICALLLLTGALSLRDPGLLRERRVRVAILLLGTIAAHYALFPALWDRFFVAQHLALVAIWIGVMADHLRRRLAPVVPLQEVREEPVQVASKTAPKASAPTT